ncbi:MAG: copper amine oxidase N-terminal domain-containing protein [Firmicutes bacterium]|nr:copper amine oxidase N-terminal domain-containing protein [Bacillota bacterium]
MNKFKIIGLTIVLLLTLALPAMAEQVDVYQNNQLVKSVVFKIGVPYYVVNGQTPGVKMDVAPFIQSDRTFVPVRFLGNALGISNDNINWIDNVQRVFIAGPNNVALTMTIGVKEIQVNDDTKPIDVAPMLQSDRTFLPARYVAEGLGYQVAWDDKNNAVVCWPAGQPEPDVSAAVDYLNSQGAAPTVVTGNKVNGYNIPANTVLDVATSGYKNSDSIVFSINIKGENLQQQYTDAQSIISQAVDADTTAKVIEFAKVTQEELLSGQPWDTKTFNSPNGMAIRVGAGWGGDTVQFDLWSTK